MRQDEQKIEAKVLQSWKLRVALLVAIVSPAVTATGAFYNMKADFQQSIVQAQEKIDQTYARKDSVQDLKEDISDVKTDVREIKLILIRRGGR